MNKSRQRRHQFYYERLKRETEFKQAAKALPMLPIKIISRNIGQPNQLSMVKQFLKRGF